MSQRIIHLCLDVRGALLNWSNREFRNVFRDNSGRFLTVREARLALMDELVKGHKVIPFGPACEGFDYQGGGCPGHDVSDEKESPPVL